MGIQLLYWHWLVLGMLLVAGEIFIPSFTILWFGLGALLVGLLLLVANLSFAWQILLWTVFSIAFTVLWFKYFKPKMVDRTTAGITRDAPFHKMTPEQWHEVIDTNLTGVFNTVHPIWPGMRERKFGRVIVISSINGQKGQFAQVNYAATKAGDLGIVKSLAQEGARAGITANAICPGYIATEMVMAVPEKVRESIIGQIPAGRLGEPEEIARCVAFLASDDSGFINGSTISANGAQFFV